MCVYVVRAVAVCYVHAAFVLSAARVAYMLCCVLVCLTGSMDSGSNPLPVTPQDPSQPFTTPLLMWAVGPASSPLSSCSDYPEYAPPVSLHAPCLVTAGAPVVGAVRTRVVNVVIMAWHGMVLFCLTCRGVRADRCGV